MVKKCAMPGNRPAQQSGLAEDLFDLITDPFAEVVLASALIGGGLAPDRISFVSHSTRLSANTPTMAVMARPMVSRMRVCVSTASLSLGATGR